MGCGTWAFWPASPENLVAPSPRPKAPFAKADQPVALLNQAVFAAANLWHTAPAPTVAQTAVQEPPKPLNVQLIGIINEGARGRKAALYDVEADRLLIIGDGESFRGHTIKSITDKAIELTDGRSGGVRTLTLAGGQS